MLHPSFRFRKTTFEGRHTRKLAGRHRFRDVSHIKFPDIFKSLRRRRFRSDVSPPSALTDPRRFPSPLPDQDSLPMHPCLPDPFSTACYRSDAASVLSATEEDCSSGMSPSDSFSEGDRNLAEEESYLFLRPILAFPTSPSVFQLRSASGKAYHVDELEHHLRQLSLGDGSPVVDRSYVGDIPACLDVSIRTEATTHHTLSGRESQKPISPHQDPDVVPMIFITSVDAKHPKPLPPSSQRHQRIPFSQCNSIDHATDIYATESKPISTDDPFWTPTYKTIYPLDYNSTFQLPSFPSTSSTSSEYSPETPTPMCCDHLGDCRGDIWEILHPPLVAGKFTLPPFEFPPMSKGLFSDTPSSSPC